MARDNEQDLEVYLGLIARWNGKEPARPLSARAIEQLGVKLEMAEREVDEINRAAIICGPRWADGVPADEVEAVIAEETAIRHNFVLTTNAYVDAIHARDLWERVKFIRQKTMPRAKDALPLQFAMGDAYRRRDMLHDLGPEFSTLRERIDADCAVLQAEDLFEIAEAKYQEITRQRRRDALNNVVRTSYRRKPRELHL